MKYICSNSNCIKCDENIDCYHSRPHERLKQCEDRGCGKTHFNKSECACVSVSDDFLTVEEMEI